MLTLAREIINKSKYKSIDFENAKYEIKGPD